MHIYHPWPRKDSPKKQSLLLQHRILAPSLHFFLQASLEKPPHTGIINRPGAQVIASVQPHPRDLGGGRRVHCTMGETCATGWLIERPLFSLSAIYSWCEFILWDPTQSNLECEQLQKGSRSRAEWVFDFDPKPLAVLRHRPSLKRPCGAQSCLAGSSVYQIQPGLLPLSVSDSGATACMTGWFTD